MIYDRLNNLLSKIIIYMLFGFMAVDMLNGVLLKAGYPSISIIYKSVTLFFAILFLLKNNKFFQIFYITLIFILYFCIHIIIVNDITVTISGLNSLIRFLAIIIWYLYFNILIKDSVHDSYNKAFIFAYISFAFLIINFICGYLGFGFSNYNAGEGETMGIKGFLFAGNEVGGAIVSAGALIQITLIEKRKYLFFIIVSILMFIMAALLGSKVSIFGSLLIFLFFPIIKASEKLKNGKIVKKDFVYSIVTISLFPIFLVLVIYYALYVSNLIVRLSFFYDKVDIVTLLLSNRNVWTLEALNLFFNKYSILENLFGSGISWFDYMADKKSIEIDIMDYLMSYGIFGVVIISSFFSHVMHTLFRNRNKNHYFGYTFFSIMLLLSISMTSGHIIDSGTAGALIAAILSLSNNKLNY